MNTRRTLRIWSALVMLATLAGADACVPARTGFVPADPELRAQPLFFYRPRDPATPARAFVFFFGNDVGFWKSHQQLSEHLASRGYLVCGFDVRRLLAALPDDSPAARDSAYATSIRHLMQEARHALGADSLPVIIGGHSIGAELAVWTAAHAAPAGTIGVLALSPGSRGHLRVTMADLANRGEPREPGSFSIPAEISGMDPRLRVAVIRGEQDRYRSADSALVAAAPGRVALFHVPLAGHSLKRLTLAGTAITRSLEYLQPTRR